MSKLLHLQSLLLSAPSTTTLPPQLALDAQTLVQTANGLNAIMDELSENRVSTVSRLIKSAAKTVLQEASLKLEFQVRKELIKLSVALVEAVHPAFQDGDDLVHIQTTIDEITRDLSVTPGFNLVAKDYIDSQLQPMLLSRYSDILETTFKGTDSCVNLQIDQTIEAVELFLNDSATPMSSPSKSKTSSPERSADTDAEVMQHSQFTSSSSMGHSTASDHRVSVEHQPPAPARSSAVRPPMQLPVKPRPKTIVSVEVEHGAGQRFEATSRPASSYNPDLADLDHTESATISHTSMPDGTLTSSMSRIDEQYQRQTSQSTPRPSDTATTSNSSVAIAQTAEKKKSGFGGFKSMLNHLTKGRPKPMRSGTKDDHTSDEVAKDHSTEVKTDVPETLVLPHVLHSEIPSTTLDETIFVASGGAYPTSAKAPTEVSQSSPVERGEELYRLSMVEAESMSAHVGAVSPALTSGTGDTEAGTEASESASSHTEIHGRKPAPSNAMSALAFVMRGGNALRKTTDHNESAQVNTSEKPIVSVNEHLESNTVHPSPPLVRPRPSTSDMVLSSSVSNVHAIETANPSCISSGSEPIATPPRPAPRSRPVSGVELNLLQPQSYTPQPRTPPAVTLPHRPISQVYVDQQIHSGSEENLGSESAPAVIQSAQPIQHSPPQTRPRPPVRPSIVHNEDPHPDPHVPTSTSTDSVDSIHAHPSTQHDNPDDHPPQVIPPKRIPGVFSTNHGALGVLAAAIQTRSSAVSATTTGHHLQPSFLSSSDGDHAEASHPTDSHQDGLASSNSHDEIVHSAFSSAPQRQATLSGSPTKFGGTGGYLGTPMTFKRKENSISGDDKALEKRSLEWMNKYLEAKEIHVEDLYTAFSDSLNLIYALESRTGESLGRYSKRPMLAVHKIDNTAVVLSFLNKRNVPTQFLTPQDLLEGNKGKILSLFTYILKVFP
ncbi:oligomeric mucus gel-forming [Batrachochytrium dendrobatidis]